jgi:hypothetical protein
LVLFSLFFLGLGFFFFHACQLVAVSTHHVVRWSEKLWHNPSCQAVIIFQFFSTLWYSCYTMLDCTNFYFI